MALVVAWVAFNGSNDSDGEMDHFMQFVTRHGDSLLRELIDAAVKLEVWPLDELAC